MNTDETEQQQVWSDDNETNIQRSCEEQDYGTSHASTCHQQTKRKKREQNRGTCDAG